MGNTFKVEAVFYGGLEHIFKKKKIEADLSLVPDIRSLLKYCCVSNESRTKLFDGSSNLQPDITILRNGRNIVFQNGLETMLSGGDTIAIFPPMTGG
ncbi:MAG: MoaD/ThiS family protein [Desulfobacterales bacterium]|nr:MoaD/ThiS family protein [Desulfobacterales bacterium]